MDKENIAPVGCYPTVSLVLFEPSNAAALTRTHLQNIADSLADANAGSGSRELPLPKRQRHRTKINRDLGRLA